MFDTLISQARDSARHSAKTAAISVGAAVAIAVGLAFWTAAGWIFLLTLTTSLNAAIIIGALYTGAGLIGFAIASMRGSRTPPPPQPAQPHQGPPTIESFITAFMTGVTAGSRTRS